MTPAEYPREIVRAHSKKLRQGDIALTEFCQLRARSGEPPGPGGLEATSGDLPYLGKPTDFEIEVPVEGGEPQVRIVRVWRTYVMVLSQNCELEHADAADSRLLVAPLAGAAQWPEGRWDYLRQSRLPGYLYLPKASSSDTGSALIGDLPESVVALGSMTLVSRALVRSNRIASLTQEMLPHLQEKLSRFLTTRGYAAKRELEALVGKQILSVEQTDEMTPGPSRLYKVITGGDGDDHGDDELTVGFSSRP